MNARRWTGARSVATPGRSALAVVFLGVFVGCGSGGDPAPAAPMEEPTPVECAPGEWLREDGSCQPAGIPLDMACPPGEWPDDSGVCQPAGLPLDMPCPPGEWLREDGGCQPAGVPPEDCADGFAPDGNGGCNVILPAVDCPKGQMAIPGETVCHEVAPCGSGDYGDIPVDPATTELVNQAYAGADSDGSEAKPWKTIQAGIDAAASGSIVAVAAGSYAEDTIIQDKPVVLWGRCPALVEVVGTGVEIAAVQVLDGNAAASEIRGIAITGIDFGLVVLGASEAVVDRVWIHDTKLGIIIGDLTGPTSATVTASLIEATKGGGVLVAGADAELSGVVVRDILSNGPANPGRGIEIDFHPASNERARVQVTASVVERAQETGVLISGADAELSGVVVRDIFSDGAGNFGRGINVQLFPETDERGSVKVTASVVERTRDTGVFVVGSDGALSGVVVRDIQPDGAGMHGRGISAQNDPKTNQRGKVQVTASMVERAEEVGVYVSGADAELSGVVVRDMLSDWTGESAQSGIGVQPDPGTNERASVKIIASVVERINDHGMLIEGSDAELSGVLVRDIQPDGAGNWGRGISIQIDPETSERANARVIASVVERTHDLGVMVSGSDAELSGVVVRDIQRDGSGEFGRGIVIQDGLGAGERANVRVIASVVERTPELGMFIVGSDAELSGVVVRDIQPDGEGRYGDGIIVQNDSGAGERANVQVTASVVERTHRFGVIVSASDVEIVAVVVRDIQPNVAGQFGAGIHVQGDPDSNQRAAVHIRASLVERSRDVGVLILDSAATIEGSIVRQTSAHEDGTVGDGIVAWTKALPAEVTITGTIVDSNARAGLGSWGATVHFTSTVLSCNAFDLQGDAYKGSPFSFPDSHDNVCGCPDVSDICNALSTGISPPPPLDDVPIPDSSSSP